MIRKGDHEAVDAVLPWFVNGSLGAREEHRVMDHLRACSACRAERDRLQDLQAFVLEEDEAEGGDYRFAFSRLMQRVDVHEANVESSRDVYATRGWQRSGWFAAAACLVAAVAFVIALNPGQPAREPDFQTLTAETGADRDASRRLALTFESPDAVRAALIKTRSSIVTGPDESGTYIVEVEVPSSMTPDAFIESFQKIDGVRHAAYAERDAR